VTIAAAVALMLRVGPNRKTPVEEPVESVAAAPATAIATPVSTESPAEAPAANAMPVVAEVRATPEATATVVTTAALTTSTLGPAPVITPQGGVAGGRELEIVAKEETWFSMALDDQPIKQYLLRAGESRKWSAGFFTITVGNAGGITLSLDGKELPPLGPTGKVVRNIRLPAEPAPTRTAVKPAALYVMGAFYVLAGMNHFLRPDVYLPMMPPYLPWHPLLIFLSAWRRWGSFAVRCARAALRQAASEAAAILAVARSAVRRTTANSGAFTSMLASLPSAS
jgi:hypothetical protein